MYICGITRLGENLKNKSDKITFTKFKLGNGENTKLTEDGIYEMVGLMQDINQNIKIRDIRLDQGKHKAVVEGVFTTDSVKQGFFWRECALYALDPEQGEILYSYAYSNEADYIATGTTNTIEEIIINMMVDVGINTKIEVNINNSMVFATQKQLEHGLQEREYVIPPFVSETKSISSLAHQTLLFLQRHIDYASDMKYKKVRFQQDTIFEIIDEYDGATPTPSNRFIPSLLKLKSHTEYDLNGSTIKVKPNNYDGYEIINMTLLEHVKIKNGYLIGDRLEHVYNDSNKTYEFGCGINIQGCKHITIENMKISQMTGDGGYIGGVLSYYSTGIKSSEIVRGSLDDSGNEVEKSDHYRISDYKFLHDYLNDEDRAKGLSLDNELYIIPGSPHGYGPLNQFTRKEVDVYFFNETKVFIEKKTALLCDGIVIPTNAVYFKFVFPNADFGTFDNQDIVIRIGQASEQCFFQNCTLSHCRRQGVSISFSINSGLKNCIVEHIKGTAPQSCIDIEDAGHLTNNIIIENNILRNSIYGIIAYDGNYHKIRGNYISDCGIGLTINACSGVVFNENTVINSRVSFGEKEPVSNGYTPQHVVVSNSSFIDCREVFFLKNTIVTGCIVKNPNDFRIKSNAIVKDCHFYIENKTNLPYIKFEESILDGVKVDIIESTGNYIDLISCNATNCYFNCKIVASGITTLSNSKLLKIGWKDATSEVTLDNIVFIDLNVDAWAFSTEAPRKLTIKNTKFHTTETYNSVYGIFSIGGAQAEWLHLLCCEFDFAPTQAHAFYKSDSPNMQILFEKCKFTGKGKIFLYDNKKYISVVLKDCMFIGYTTKYDNALWIIEENNIWR